MGRHLERRRQQGGYGDPTFPDGPERFRDAFRHFVRLFREEGATNVTWVFHMVQWYAPDRGPFANYYPGDEYVDWLALSTFGTNNLPDGSTASFEQVWRRSTRRTTPVSMPTSPHSARNRLLFRTSGSPSARRA